MGDDWHGGERSGAVNFEEAQAEYTRLRQGYQNGQISADEFGRRVQALQVRAASGAYWAIDGASGNWLRYDGSNWVPGQPPVAQSPQPGYGAAPASGYTPQPQPQTQYGSSDPGATQIAGQPYTPPQSNYQQAQPQTPVYPVGAAGAGVQPAQKKRSRTPLIAGCAVLIVVLLLACGVGSFIAVRSGAFDTTAGLTAAATAKTIKSDKTPDQTATDFSVNGTMYITYTAKNAKKGQTVDLKLLLNGSPIQLTGSETTFEKDATYHGYYSYTPSRAGQYTAELYYNGETTPSETLTFTVK
jgi:hypothetical protein